MKKVCPRCKIEYQSADKHFHKNRLNRDGLASVCKECKRIENIFIKSSNPVEIVNRICAFEDCNKKFKVLATNKQRKYCCTYCRDRASKYKNGKDNFRFKVNFNNRFRTRIEEKTALNNNKKWSDAELKKLVKSVNEGLGWSEIGKKLKRKSRSCMRKYHDIKLMID